MGRLRAILTASLLSATLLAGCALSRGPEPTATISPDEVLLTAQAIARQTLEATTPTPTRTPIPPTDTVPAESPTPIDTATPASPIVTADYNSNVRAGPGEEYEIIDFLLIGQSANVAGRYDDSPIGTWWFIRRIGEQGRDGWIWGGAVTLGGSALGVPVLEAPPTSTPSPEPTEKPSPSDTPGPTAAPTETETSTP